MPYKPAFTDRCTKGLHKLIDVLKACLNFFCYFPNSALISAAEGAARISSYLLWRGVLIREKMVSLGIRTHVGSRDAPDWDFWRTLLYRLSYSAAARVASHLESPLTSLAYQGSMLITILTSNSDLQRGNCCELFDTADKPRALKAHLAQHLN